MSQGGKLGGTGTFSDLTFLGNTGPGASPALDIVNVLGAGGSTVDATGNTLTITVSGGGGLTWSTISANQALVVDHGYFCTAGLNLSLSLPATSTVGQVVEISLDGASGFTVTQGAGQSIRLGSSATTAGVGGSLASTAQGDSIRMVCSVADLKWNVLSSEGNLTIV